ncbi:MAG TPA: PAS domain S-box protein, partial [Candidatus Binatia bacterium]|nr:PAS domain S-box protein [Candidatus Binatia bacterium]
MDLPRGLQVKQRQQLGESDLLLSLYRSLIENADLASGLRSALEIVCQFAGWAVGTAWLPGEDGSRLEFVAGWQVDDPKLSEFIFACANQKFQPNFGMIGRLWEKRNPEWTRNLAAEPRELFPFAPLAIHAGLSAALCVPIARGNEINGVLTFHAREVKDEDDRLVQIVSRVATQLGFALHQRQTEQELRRQETRVRRGNEELDRAVLERTSSLSEATELLQAEVAARTQVQDRLEQRVRQQAAAAEIGRRALQGIELSALLDQTVALVMQTLGVEFCKILELSPDKQTLLLRAGAGWKEGCVGVATVSAGAKSQAGYTLLSKTPIIVEDLKTETRFSEAPLLADHNVASGLSVIIGHQDRPYGVLGAHTTALRAFTKDDIHFLEAVATMLFQVIEHDNDMKQIRRSASWLKRLIHTTQDAVISIDRRGCVVLFNAAAERVFGYKSGEIFGRKVNDLMAEPYASEHDGYIARYERTGEPRAIGRIRTVEGRRKSGEVFPLELSVTEIEVDQDVHYAAFIRDISEKTKLQAQLI